ncbi:uncharacterized protein [Clytia hemisphaerica]|uniref:Uncharacterized protein n=1 Tax=Clytia hemisphaerica TaxID=252671 RepID=A0A7M5XF52_9CNID
MTGGITRTILLCCIIILWFWPRMEVTAVNSVSISCYLFCHGNPPHECKCDKSILTLSGTNIFRSSGTRLVTNFPEFEDAQQIHGLIINAGYNALCVKSDDHSACQKPSDKNKPFIIDPTTKFFNYFDDLKIVANRDGVFTMAYVSNAFLAKFQLKSFKYYNANEKADAVEIGSICPTPSHSDIDIFIRCRSKRLILNMPKVPAEKTMQGLIEVDYKVPNGNIEWKYYHTMGSIQTCTLSIQLAKKSDDFWSFVPTEMLRENKIKSFTIQIDYLDQSSTEKLVFDEVVDFKGKANLVWLDRAEFETIEGFPDIFPSEKKQNSDEHTITLNYVIVNLRDALNEMVYEAVENEGVRPKFVINTQVLIWKDVLKYKIHELQINYRVLMYQKGSKLFVVNPKPTDTNSGVSFNVLPMDLKSMYEIMLAIAMMGKPSFFHNSAQRKAKRIMLKKFVKSLKEFVPSELAIQNSNYQTFFKTDAFMKKTQLFQFLERQAQKTSLVPRLSKSIYKEKTIFLQQLGENLGQKDRFKYFKEGQKSLMMISKMKTTTQRLIVIKELEELLTNHAKQKELVGQYQRKRRQYENEVKSEESEFKKGVKRRETEAYVEAAFTILDIAFSAFSGKFVDPGKLLETISRLHKLANTLKAIKRTITKIKDMGKITNDQFKNHFAGWQKTSEFAGEFLKTTQSVKVAKDGFNPGEMDALLGKVLEVDPSDLLEWDVAIKDVETMMDSSLTAEVSETNNYKKALLRMMTAGRAETEAILMKSKIEANIVLKIFEKKNYENEEAEIVHLSAKMDRGVTKDLFDDNYELAMLQYRLEMFFHLIDYCDASFYYSLTPCTSYTNFQYHSSLDEIIHLTNKMLVEDVDNLNDLYPPPQSFFDKKIEFTWSHRQCSKFYQLFKQQKTPLTDFQKGLRNGCLKSKIAELMDDEEDHSFTFNVPLHHEQFNIFDRVRIDEVKIFMRGAKTRSGMLTVNIESSGLYQDVMDGQNFTFSGEIWSRTFRYNLSSNTNDQFEIKGDIHQSYKDVFSRPTPFTHWMVTVPKIHNEGLDLKDVTKIEILFSGQLMVSRSPAREAPEIPNFEEILSKG